MPGPDGGLFTPLGNSWCVASGYDDTTSGLGAVLVATSPLFGWRNSPQMLTTVGDEGPDRNTFYAISEQSFVIGWEQTVSAQQIELG